MKQTYLTISQIALFWYFILFFQMNQNWIHETMNNRRSLSTISIKLNEFRQPYELITLKKKVEATRCHSCAFIKKEECAGGRIFLDMKWSSQLSWGGRGSYSISFSQPYAIVRLHFMNFKLSDLGNILDVANHGSNSGFKLTKLRLKQIQNLLPRGQARRLVEPSTFIVF